MPYFQNGGGQNQLLQQLQAAAGNKNPSDAETLLQLLQGIQRQQAVPPNLAQMLTGGASPTSPNRATEYGGQSRINGGGLASMLNPDAVTNLFQNQPKPGLESILPPLPSMEELQALKAQEVDPNQNLLEMLLGASGGGQSQGALDLEAMMSDATKGVGSPFNAQIGLLKHQNAAAKADTQAGKKQINKMYRALAKDQRRMGRREAAQSGAMSDRLRDLGTAGAQQLHGSTSDILSQNAAAGAGLGSPELTAALNPEAAQQGQRLEGNIIQAATGQAANQLATGNNTRRFFNRAAGSSRLEGVNRSADLISNLQDYLAGNRAQIGELAGQKAQALAAAKNQILAGVAQQRDDSAQQGFENKLDIVKWWTGLQNDIANREAGNGEEGSDFSSLFPKDMGNAMGIIGNSPQLKNPLMDLLGTEEIQRGITQGSNPVALDSYATMMQFLKDSGKLPSNEQDATALIGALLQLMGDSRLPSM